MPNFRHAPFCRSAVFAEVEPRIMTGNTVVDWMATSEDGITKIIPDADLRTRGYPLGRQDGGAGIYAIAETGEAKRYQFDHKEGVVHFEDGSQLPVSEFITRHVRSAPDGSVLCSFLDAFHVQHQILMEAGAAGSAHRYDLQELVSQVRSDGFESATGMYDIVSAGLDDEIPFFERMQAMTAPSWSDTAIESLSATGIPSQAWGEIKDLPEYNIDQVRALFRMLMAPYIGEFPIERVKRLHAPPGVPLGEMFTGAGTLRSTNEPFEAGNILRGYRTSEVQHFDLPGVETIVFSDPMGTYAYAWPTYPKHDLEPKGDLQP